MDEDNVYLIWSHEHAAWWGPGGHGYTQRIGQAGLYSREEALRVCAKAIPGTAHRMGVLPELPIPFSDLHHLVAGFQAAYPGKLEPWL